MAPERPIITCVSCEVITCKGFASNPDVRRVEDKDGEVIAILDEGVQNCGVLFGDMTEEYYLWLIDWYRREKGYHPFANDLFRQP